MPSFADRLTRYLRFRFIDGPRGQGRPIPASLLDHEYASGRWNHFFEVAELPRNAVLAALIRERSPAPARVLDLGCGSGRLAAVFAPGPGVRWLGVDLSQQGLARARELKLSGVELVQGSFESWLPTDGEQFDAIIFNESIGYAAAPASTLRHFAPYLAPRGRFFISLFRSGNAESQWRAIAAVATTEFACAISVEKRVWDVRVLTAERPH